MIDDLFYIKNRGIIIFSDTTDICIKYVYTTVATLWLHCGYTVTTHVYAVCAPRQHYKQFINNKQKN